MHEINNVGLQPRLANIHLWHETGKHGHSGVESQMYQDSGEHVNKVHGNPQAIAHGCASIFHYPGYNCPDAIMQHLNDIFTLCDELVQLGFILQGVSE